MDWLSGEIYSISQTSQFLCFCFTDNSHSLFFSLHLLKSVYKKHHSLYTSVFSWNLDKKFEILTFIRTSCRREVKVTTCQRGACCTFSPVNEKFEILL